MAKSAPLPGTSDIFPAEIGAWRFLEKTARDVFERYANLHTTLHTRLE